MTIHDDPKDQHCYSKSDQLDQIRTENANLTRIQQDQANVITNLQNEINRCLEALGNPPDDLLTNVVKLRRLADIGKAWEENSSLEVWFPITAQSLGHHKTLLEECQVALEATLAASQGFQRMKVYPQIRECLTHLKALEKEGSK